MSLLRHTAKDERARINSPSRLTLVRGAASSRKQIFLYSLLFTPICLAPAFTGLALPGETPHLHAWHDRVSSRASAAA